MSACVENENDAFKFLIHVGEKKSHCILLAIPDPVRQKKDHRFLFFGKSNCLFFLFSSKRWKENRKTEYKRRSEREGKKSVGKEKGRIKKYSRENHLVAKKNNVFCNMPVFVFCCKQLT